MRMEDTMKVTVAAAQMSCGWEQEANLDKAEGLVRAAVDRGANIVLLQEMFFTHFFGFMDWKPEHFALARPAGNNPMLERMAALARELGVVLPVNFFERANHAYYNTIMIIDADGRQLGIYRKSHIPMGPPGCFEKVYTSPGDTGFKAWKTCFGTIGVGICWDQWFPESARAMCVQGAELLFYPTAIGTDCHGHWQRTMQGHAAANLAPLVAANRVGTETGELGSTTFWGRSFIAGPTGEIAAEAGSEDGEIVAASFDLEEIREMRANWGLFRDRRPDLYAPPPHSRRADEGPTCRQFWPGWDLTRHPLLSTRHPVSALQHEVMQCRHGVWRRQSAWLRAAGVWDRQPAKYVTALGSMHEPDAIASKRTRQFRMLSQINSRARAQPVDRAIENGVNIVASKPRGKEKAVDIWMSMVDRTSQCLARRVMAGAHCICRRAQSQATIAAKVEQPQPLAGRGLDVRAGAARNLDCLHAAA